MSHAAGNKSLTVSNNKRNTQPPAFSLRNAIEGLGLMLQTAGWGGRFCNHHMAVAWDINRSRSANPEYGMGRRDRGENARNEGSSGRLLSCSTDPLFVLVDVG